MGEVAQLDNETASFALGQRVVCLSGKPYILDNDFLKFLLMSPTMQERLLTYATGTTVAGISQKALRSVPLTVPSLTEQRAIAVVLGALDDKIELNRNTAATLEAMARALYQSWFVDFDPVHAKAEGRAPAHMDEATAALFPSRFTDDGLPEGWRFARLNEILTLNYGKALRKDLRVPGPYPVFGSGGSDSNHLEALIAEPTIIVGRKGTVGSVIWAPRGCWPIDTTFFVTSAFPLPFVLRNLQYQPLTDMNTDAAVPGLNRENVYRLEIPFPPPDIIETFDHLASPWQEKIDQLSEENQTLAALRDTLLPRLMSGELRVGEAREQVEDAA